MGSLSMFGIQLPEHLSSKRRLNWDSEFSKRQMTEQDKLPYARQKSTMRFYCLFMLCLAFIGEMCASEPAGIIHININGVDGKQVNTKSKCCRQPSWKPHTDLSSGEIHQSYCSTTFHPRGHFFTHGLNALQRIPHEICIRWQATCSPHWTTTSEEGRVGVMMLFD